MSTRSSRGFFITVIVLGLVVMLLSGSSATAADGCKRVEGKITVAPSAQCPMCGVGTIKGDIKGEFAVATTWMGSSANVPEIPNPYVVFLTADTVFTMRDGSTLSSQDATTLSAGTGEYAEIVTITGGTGSYAGATGTLVTTGTVSLATGSASGTYNGKICRP